ncbi:hypothetical protein GALMADRAFT_588244 [Galerina marginata CBS 339.88]|uniref:F-box domain-containing protein n=1 Tax=Galerina marginata (strain CBS 339.88) TaxID=685588 RepID=A0A067SWT2_GALM3|nr:hypothetical protein GALMADRAFT_588244 [Galerina marginata CBS 339.88]
MTRRPIPKSANWGFKPAHRYLGLFASLQERSFSPRLHNFAQILQQDPARSYPDFPPLASHIRFLTVQLDRGRHTKNLAPGTKSIFSDILPLLTSVEKFSLKTVRDTFDSRLYSCSWDFIDDTKKSAILEFCKSPSIITMHISHMERLPPNLFTGCPNLKVLSLDTVESPRRDLPASWSTSPAEFQPWTSSLETLSIKYSGEMACLLSEMHRYTEFKSRPPSFMASIWKMDVSSSCWAGLLSEWVLIQTISESSLRYLRISGIRCVVSQIVNFPGAVDFGILKRVETLELQGRFGVEDQGLRTFHHWTTFSTKSNLADSTSIRTLIFDIEWVGCRQGDEDNIFVPDHGWLTIDAALSSGRFASLKNICLRLHITFLPNSIIGIPEDRLQRLISDKLSLRIPQLFPSISISKSKSIKTAVTVKSSNLTFGRLRPALD